jgi:predicted transcriptional regulator
VGRDVKNINDDLALLANVGLLELRKTTRGRKNVVPCGTVDKIQVESTVEIGGQSAPYSRRIKSKVVKPQV